MKLEEIHEHQIISAANEMMEMANLYPTKTGVQYAIWFGEVGGQHGPRIKVSNLKGKMSSDCFVVTVSKTPVVITPKSVKISRNDVDDVMDWVVLNYDTLMKLWAIHETGDGDVDSLLSQLKKLT